MFGKKTGEKIKNKISESQIKEKVKKKNEVVKSFFKDTIDKMKVS